MNHFESLINVYQNTIENNSSKSSYAPHSDTVLDRSEGVGMSTTGRIENRLNSLENQVIHNLHLQNQMALQNQMNLQSLFYCQNQLIMGLAERQYIYNPYSTHMPKIGHQCFSQNQQPIPMYHPQYTPGMVRPTQMFQPSAMIPPPSYQRQAAPSVVYPQSVISGPVHHV